MGRKMCKSNPLLVETISALKKQSFEQEAAIWKDIALRLERPLRNWPEVNLSRIERYVLDGETALVPGKVLSPGQLSKGVSVAAWGFSARAEQKIKAAGGKTMSIADLMKSNPTGKNVRILG